MTFEDLVSMNRGKQIKLHLTSGFVAGECGGLFLGAEEPTTEVIISSARRAYVRLNYVAAMEVDL